MAYPDSFEDSFARLCEGMTTAEVEDLVGPPHTVEDTIVPANSGWGMQDSLAYPIRGGESVLQWTYLSDDQDHCVWFARLEEGWRLTLLASLPFGTASDRSAS